MSDVGQTIDRIDVSKNLNSSFSIYKLYTASTVALLKTCMALLENAEIYI